MATFVVAHGAWSAAWAWKKMRPLMRTAGHELWTPTYTGLGERAHLGHVDVSLDTHIQDVVAVLEAEDLTGIHLIGHSYGGMVATGVADRARDRIAHLIYLDAFAPMNGQGVFDLVPPDARLQRIRRAHAGRRRDLYRVHVARQQPVARQAGKAPQQHRNQPADRQSGSQPDPSRRLPQPVKAFSTKLTLSAEPSAPRTYIYARKAGIGDNFRKFYDRAKREGWNTYQIESSHNPHITNPQALLAILNEIAA